MANFSVLEIAGRSLAAQSTRLNTVASNLANADTVAGSPEEVYRARHPVFRAMLTESGDATVQVTEIRESQAEPEMRYMPGHPEADEKGYVYAPGIDAVEAMADMLSASRSYQSSLEVMNTTKDLMMRTLQTGRG